MHKKVQTKINPQIWIGDSHITLFVILVDCPNMNCCSLANRYVSSFPLGRGQHGLGHKGFNGTQNRRISNQSAHRTEGKRWFLFKTWPLLHRPGQSESGRPVSLLYYWRWDRGAFLQDISSGGQPKTPF
uniref:Zinc finger protein 99 n=1 Tax=Rousettus aegyptiacus TaxID=9407 RepID=A0A7J8BXD8_ROUAE|nr:zinc finger protein 99 [Rousettus aegyptiacus]